MNKRPPVPSPSLPEGHRDPGAGEGVARQRDGWGSGLFRTFTMSNSKKLACRERLEPFTPSVRICLEACGPSLPLLPFRRRVWPCAGSYCRLVLGPIGPGFVVWTGEPWLTMHAHDQSLGRLKGRAAVAMTLYERKRHMAGLIHELAVKRKSLASA